MFTSVLKTIKIGSPFFLLGKKKHSNNNKKCDLLRGKKWGD